MNDTKMLQAILNGQTAIREVLGKQIQEVIGEVKKLDRKIDSVEARLTSRIDKIGKQIAFVEDDAPTREEFDNLESRIVKVEKRIVS